MRWAAKKCVVGEVGVRCKIFIPRGKAEVGRGGWARVPFGGEKQLNVSPTVTARRR